jgi:hypothetical protein
VDLMYAGELGSDVKQNQDSYALVLEDPEIVNGSLYVNQGKPDDGNVRDVAADDSTSPTDYRVVSEDSGVGTYVNDMFTTGEESVDDDGNGLNVYDPVDDFAEDRIVIFYNGMSGSRVGRTLDFNGRNYARWTETPYLTKGLYQAHPDWRGAGSQQRAELASEGNAPRVARPPVPRFKVDGQEYLDEGTTGEEILIDVTIYNEDDPTSGYEVHIFDVPDFEEEFDHLGVPVSEMDRGQYGLDVDSELEYVNHDDPETILEQAQVPYMMYEGDWTSEPDDWTLEYNSGLNFGIADELADDSAEQPDDTGSSLEDELGEFADEISTYLPEGEQPESAFDGGLSGLIDRKAEMFSEQPSEEDVESVRQEIYAEVSWLDESDVDGIEA